MRITDQYGRSFKTLRVSLTNVCNLACVYCTTNAPKVKVEKSLTLSAKQLAHYVAQLHQVLQLDTLRLTGGEPTLYPHLLDFVKQISPLQIPNLKMTTNGYRLAPFIKPLADLGLSQINVSLDATTEASFNKIANSKNLTTILNAIDSAIAQGIAVKLNAVILKGINDDQIIPLLDFAHQRGITLRFLELMRMGPMYEASQFDQYFFSQADILEKIKAHYLVEELGRPSAATAQYFQALGSAKFGIIANESEPFCSDCERLRLDSYGRIYGCLSNEQPIYIADHIDDALALQQKLIEALHQKQAVKFTGSPISMLHIGG